MAITVLYDPAGNMVELHQAGQCRCRKGERMDRTASRPAMPG